MELSISLFCSKLCFLPAILFWSVCSAYSYGNEFETIEKNELLLLIEQIDVSYYGGWDSHYYSEGRDNLDGDSLIVNDVQLGWEFISGGLWYVASPDQSYDELQAILAVTQSVGNFAFYLSYTHLQFPSDNFRDNEVGAGVALFGLPANLQLAADVYYSFDADGSFAELAAVREFTLTESLSIAGMGIFGINQGYISDGHDGSNHFALKLESTYTISDSISIIAQITQSWEIDRETDSPGDDPLVDFFHGSIGVQWSL